MDVYGSSQMMKQIVLVMVCVCALGCGDDDVVADASTDTPQDQMLASDQAVDVVVDTQPDATLDAMPDASVEGPEFPPVVCPDDDGSARRPLLAAVRSGTESFVEVFEINEQGRVFSTGTRLGAVVLPQAIAINSTGTEALLAWGSSGNGMQNGVTVISLAGPPAITQPIKLDDGFGPGSIAYLNDDHAVITRIGRGDDNVVPFTRDASGMWTAGTPWAIPNEWPRNVTGFGDGTGAVVRTSPLDRDAGAEVYGIEVVDGAIVSIGEPWAIPQTPSFIYGHPNVRTAFLPTSVDGQNAMNPPGDLLHASLGVDGWTLAPSSPFRMPNLSSRLQFRSAEELLVAESVSRVFMIDDMTASVESRDWSIDSIAIADGVPTGATENLLSVRAILVHQIIPGPSGSLVMAIDSGVQVPDYDDGLVSFTEGANGWEQVCDAIPLAGGADLVMGSTIR